MHLLTLQRSSIKIELSQMVMMFFFFWQTTEVDSEKKGRVKRSKEQIDGARGKVFNC